MGTIDQYLQGEGERVIEASSAGIPFPEEEAEARFRQFREEGSKFVRLIITWEALEHLGPGLYDEAYLAFLRKLLLAADKQELSVFMAPRQHGWSRWTDGEGAPAWTLETLGMDPARLDAAGTAPVKRYASSTLFSLFFGGNVYAPGLETGGERVQDWLQERYIAAMRHCFRRLKNCRAIAGWGAMGGACPGFIGYGDLREPESKGPPLPSPFEAMLTASGHSGGASIFKPGFTCPWKQSGVWTDEGGEARLLKPDHFALFQGRKPLFTDDFLKPFMGRFIERMRETRETTLFFVGDEPVCRA